MRYLCNLISIEKSLVFIDISCVLSFKQIANINEIHINKNIIKTTPKIGSIEAPAFRKTLSNNLLLVFIFSFSALF